MLNDSSHNSPVDWVKRFMRHIGIQTEAIDSLVKEGPGEYEDDRGKYYVDSIGTTHPSYGLGGGYKLEDGTIGAKTVYYYHDLITYHLTPEEIEERISDKIIAKRNEEGALDARRFYHVTDPESVGGGSTSYNVRYSVSSPAVLYYDQDTVQSLRASTPYIQPSVAEIEESRTAARIQRDIVVATYRDGMDVDDWKSIDTRGVPIRSVTNNNAVAKTAAVDPVGRRFNADNEEVNNQQLTLFGDKNI